MATLTPCYIYEEKRELGEAAPNPGAKKLVRGEGSSVKRHSI